MKQAASLLTFSYAGITFVAVNVVYERCYKHPAEGLSCDRVLLQQSSDAGLHIGHEQQHRVGVKRCILSSSYASSQDASKVQSFGKLSLLQSNTMSSLERCVVAANAAATMCQVVQLQIQATQLQSMFHEPCDPLHVTPCMKITCALVHKEITALTCQQTVMAASVQTAVF